MSAPLDRDELNLFGIAPTWGRFAFLYPFSPNLQGHATKLIHTRHTSACTRSGRITYRKSLSTPVLGRKGMRRQLIGDHLVVTVNLIWAATESGPLNRARIARGTLAVGRRTC